MSGLATRCPACSTIFRVVPDQLRVSDGWVRCGRCAEVFNAAERLVDVDTGAPSRTGGSALPAAAPAPAAAYAAAPLAAPAAAADFVGRVGVAPAAAPGARAPTAALSPQQAPSAPAAAPARDLDPGFGPALEADDKADPDAGPRRAAPGAAFHAVVADRDEASGFATTAAAIDSTPPPGAVEPTPSFVRQAERAERWRSPRMRQALAGGVAAAALLLGAQAVLAWRDGLAARHPALKPALEGVCAALGCSVGPPRHIDGLSVESSGLVRLEKSALYRLSVALRNRSATGVALPALELSLTDSQGRLLVRRVLRGTDFGVNQDTVAPGAEVALQATLQAALGGGGNAAEPIAGYTIELFYP